MSLDIQRKCVVRIGEEVLMRRSVYTHTCNSRIRLERASARVKPVSALDARVDVKGGGQRRAADCG
jgi:hypothetical protein